jgi:type II secretory pathway pseudopilin PulG
LFVFTLVIAILLAVLLPAIQQAREEARRMSCSGQVSQIATALHNDHSAYGRLPPPINVSGASGNPIKSPYGVWGAIGTRASTEADVGFN